MIPFGRSCFLPLFWLTNNLFKQTNSSLSFMKEYSKLMSRYRSKFITGNLSSQIHPYSRYKGAPDLTLALLFLAFSYIQTPYYT